MIHNCIYIQEWHFTITDNFQAFMVEWSLNATHKLKWKAKEDKRKSLFSLVLGIIPGKRYRARPRGKLGFWQAWSWRESRRSDWPYFSLRPTMISQFCRHLESRGTVASLWRRSWGWWRMMIFVAVGKGDEGRVWQRQTLLGRPHPVVHVLRRCSSWPQAAEEDDAGSSHKSIGLLFWNLTGLG